jgi:hypothetical protein
MFSKHEASKLRQEFWTAFGVYMSPVLSAEQEKINWINYKTGVKNVAFKMNADNKVAFIAIELSHNNPEVQQLYFEQLGQFKNLLHEIAGEEWEWQLLTPSGGGKPVSRVVKTLEGLSIYNKQDWPGLISFFKPRIIALDGFWTQVKYGFDD